MSQKIMFHVKHIIAVIMTVVIMTMAVSAEYKAMTLLDSGWGVGSVYSDSIGKGKVQSYIDAAGYTDSNSYEDFVYWSIPIKSGYTYKLTYQLNTNATYINPQSSGTYKSSAKQPVSTNLTDTIPNATVSIVREGSTYYFTVLFNQEKSNIPAADSIYIYQFMNKQQLSTITVSGIGAAAYYDPGAAGVSSSPSTLICPSCKGTNPRIALSSDVLPHPESPVMHTTCPSSALNESPPSSSCSPIFIFTFFISNIVFCLFYMFRGAKLAF